MLFQLGELGMLFATPCIQNALTEVWSEGATRWLKSEAEKLILQGDGVVWRSTEEVDSETASVADVEQCFLNLLGFMMHLLVF